MPPKPRQPAPLLHQTPITKESPPKTKPARLSTHEPNITSPESSRRLHELRDRRLQSYIDYPRRNYRRLSAELCELVAPEHEMCLHPCNARARIRFAGIVHRELLRFTIPQRAPLQWVTIAPGRFAVPLARAREFNFKPLIGLIRAALGRIPFLAIVEATHYRSSPHLPSPSVMGRNLKMRPSDMVSWHAHLITWGFSRAAVLAALQALRRRHRDMLGRDCVDVRTIEPNQATEKMLYASKGQTKSYRHYLKRGIDIDPETGEIVRRIRQSKDAMRTGDHVKMIEVFGRMRIDELVFGGGQGTDVANVMRCNAMLPFCRWASKRI